MGHALSHAAGRVILLATLTSPIVWTSEACSYSSDFTRNQTGYECKHTCQRQSRESKQMEVDLDTNLFFDGLAVLEGGSELPTADGFNGLFIEGVSHPNGTR